jgi:hypothetical protein
MTVEVAQPLQFDDQAMQLDPGTYSGENFESLPSGIRNACPKQRLTDEEKLARDCLRRRQTDLERRARIFDAKRRMIGVDKEALDAQITEKKSRATDDKGAARKEFRDMCQIDKTLKLIEVEKQRQRREQEMACKEFSLQALNFQSRREFDLNDPLAKRKALPTRVGDHDPRCGPSSVQKFSGEDLMKDERVRQQRAAMVSTIEQQIFEKAMLSKQVNDGGFGVQVQEITALRNEIEENELALRKELQRKQYEDNINQANENRERKVALMLQNMDANDRELNFHASDKFLNENSASHFNSRVIRDAYKGSSRLERVQVAAEQQQQRLQKEITKTAEKYDDRYCGNTSMETTRRQLVAMERDKQRRRREMREQNAWENCQLAAEQRANKRQLNKLYKNEFSPEFFEQFGTGCR